MAKLFKTKPREKYYFSIWDDGSDFLITSSLKTRERFLADDPIRKDRRYFEFDAETGTSREVDIQIIISVK